MVGTVKNWESEDLGFHLSMPLASCWLRRSQWYLQGSVSKSRTIKYETDMWSAFEDTHTSQMQEQNKEGCCCVFLCIVYYPLWSQTRSDQRQKSQHSSGELWDWKEVGRCLGGELVLQKQESKVPSKSQVWETRILAIMLGGITLT